MSKPYCLLTTKLCLPLYSLVMHWFESTLCTLLYCLKRGSTHNILIIVLLSSETNFFLNTFCLLLRYTERKQMASLTLTPSLRRPFKHAIFFSTACWTACKHAFRFLRVLPEAVSTRHSWLWQTLDDVYTRRCFSESEETRFGAPGKKALPSMNEFTLLWIFA